MNNITVENSVKPYGLKKIELVGFCSGAIVSVGTLALGISIALNLLPIVAAVVTIPLGIGIAALGLFFFIESLSLILYFSKYSYKTESPESEDSESVPISSRFEVFNEQSSANLSKIISDIIALEDMESFIDKNSDTFKLWIRELDKFSCVDDFKNVRNMRNLQLDLKDRDLKQCESYVITSLGRALKQY